MHLGQESFQGSRPCDDYGQLRTTLAIGEEYDRWHPRLVSLGHAHSQLRLALTIREENER